MPKLINKNIIEIFKKDCESKKTIPPHYFRIISLSKWFSLNKF